VDEIDRGTHDPVTEPVETDLRARHLDDVRADVDLRVVDWFRPNRMLEPAPNIVTSFGRSCTPDDELAPLSSASPTVAPRSRLMSSLPVRSAPPFSNERPVPCELRKSMSFGESLIRSSPPGPTISMPFAAVRRMPPSWKPSIAIPSFEITSRKRPSG
jgi:hypothetical protein